MDLFTPIVPVDKQHPIFQLLLLEENSPERDVVRAWADGFVDRDRKFVKEFQTTFESSFWELYLYSVLKEYGAETDFSHSAPDFEVKLSEDICIEAVIAAPEQKGRPNYGWSIKDIPEDFTEFNRESTLRICNSLSSKIKKYRDSYSTLEHVKGKPFLIAFASFDRPLAHMAANRPIMAALYGEYFDEEATPKLGSDYIVHYPVDSVIKGEQTTVPVGYFLDESHKEVSAVIFSSVATWGKIRALSDNDAVKAIFMTAHPQAGTIDPLMRFTPKSEYSEHLLDGLYVFHNPFAENPINVNVFDHPRVAQFYLNRDGEFVEACPDDFLLMRMIHKLSGEVPDIDALKTQLNR